MEFPKHESEVVSGQCWLSVEGVPEAVRLTAGDCFLLPRGLSSCLASDLTLTAVDAHTIFLFPLNGRIASCNGGEDCLLVGGNFVLTGKPADILSEAAAIVHIRNESDKAAIRWSLERMRDGVPHTLANAASTGQKDLITISGHTGAQSLPELAFECEST